MCGERAVTSMSERSSSSRMRSPSASMPRTQCSSKERQPSASSRPLCKAALMMSGLYTFSSRCPEAPPMFTATSLAITCRQSMVSASACVGFTLPGMMELPGSFSGMRSSASPERGPEASRRTSLPILNSAAAKVFIAPCAKTSASCPASAANLFGASRNCRRVSSLTSWHTRAANCGCVLRPVPTAVPPIARRHRAPGPAPRAADRRAAQAGRRRAQRRLHLLELVDVAGELLSERQRRRILEMRTSDLDDVTERVALARERRAQRLHRRQHLIVQRLSGGDVHRGREHVVGRLPHVDIVVRMDEALGAALAAEELGGTIGEHLIDVHVALRAGAGLPHHQWKFAVVLGGEHLVGRAPDGFGLALIEQ